MKRGQSSKSCCSSSPLKLSLLVLLPLVALDGPMLARTARAQAAPDASPATTALEPITVTARKIPELQQEVPISVTAFDSATMRERRIYSMDDVVREVPNIGFSSLGDGRSTFLSIRGIGPMSQPLSYDDTSTVTYVDGVPQPLFGSDMRLFDLDRVEVLRGPQGTLFGRNAQAGAINIITNKPGDRTEFFVHGELGSDWYRVGEGFASGPLIPGKLSGRIAAYYSGVEGDVLNIAPGLGNLGSVQNGALRATFVATPDSNTTFTFSIFGEKDGNRPSNFVLRNSFDFPVVALNPEGYARRGLGGAALTAQREFTRLMLTSVTAYNHYDYQQLSNNSEALTFSRVFGLPASTFLPATDFSYYNERQNSFYQEIRLNSLPEATIKWVTGLTYYHDNFALNSYYQSPFFPATNGWRYHDYSTNSYAAFGEATVPVPGLERLKITAGLRYTHDDKTYDAQYRSNGFPGTVAAYRQAGSLGFDLVTGRAALSYDVTESSTIHATVSHGAKSGGFPNFTNNAPAGQPDLPYGASTSWSYEIGTKNQLAGGRGFLNAALFFNDVKGQNLFALDSASFTFVPKPLDTESFGAEIEMGYRLTRGLDLFAAVGYTHAIVKNVSADVAASSGARAGNRVPGAPGFTSSVTLQYRESAAWLGLPSSANVIGMAQHQYIGERAADVGNHFNLDSYQMVNLKAGLEFEGFNVYAFGQNLVDARPQYIGLYYGSTAQAVTVGHGRIVGIGASMRF